MTFRPNADYPFILINAFEDDLRTPLWNVLKFASRFRNMVSTQNVQTLPRFILEQKKLFLNIESGHHMGTFQNEQMGNVEVFKLCFHEFAILGSPAVDRKYKMRSFLK